jgi:hypothetical protein
VIPRFLEVGTNIVTDTYRLGALRFFNLADPYALPLIGGDRFEYSPFFALLYYPFAILPVKWQAIAWAGFNSFLFWYGILKWQNLKGASWLLWLAVIACSMELNICLLYQQINAALIGMTLLGLYHFKEKEYVRAGIWLALATNIKTLPAFFAIPLLFSRERRYFVGILMGSLFTLLSPALVVGLKGDLLLHWNWILRLWDSLWLVRAEQADVATSLTRLGFSALLGKAVQVSVLLSTLFFLSFQAAKTIRWHSWVALAACGLILASPRTESPSFVISSIAYFFLMLQVLENKNPLVQGLSLILLGISFFLITLSFTDVWQKKWWNPGDYKYATKSFGTLLMWILALLFHLFNTDNFHEPVFLKKRLQSQRGPA